MPRRRQRKTNWKPQDERRLSVRGVRRDTPDMRKLSRAFSELALARAEAAAQAQAERQAWAGQEHDGGEGAHADGAA